VVRLPWHDNSSGNDSASSPQGAQKKIPDFFSAPKPYSPFGFSDEYRAFSPGLQEPASPFFDRDSSFYNVGFDAYSNDIFEDEDATLWALVCTAKALNMSGITDPYELYKYVHPSEVGTSLGSPHGQDVQRSSGREGRAERHPSRDLHQHHGWLSQLASYVVERPCEDSRRSLCYRLAVAGNRLRNDFIREGKGDDRRRFRR
ncbi:hypothetical protein K438DRAFT_2041941, partial [Mycena galopus ATCC 62051]